MEKNILILTCTVVGVIAIFALAAFLQNLWAGYFAAFILAAGFLLLLDRQWVTHLESHSAKMTIRIFLVLLVMIQISVSLLHYSKADRQDRILTDIRATIIESISKIEMERALNNTLRYYYLESDPEEQTLESSFRELYSEHLLEEGKWLPETPNEDNDMLFTYEIATPDSIILSISTHFTRGMDPDFSNITQQTGMYQARAILTERGVRYEREN